MCLGRCWLSSVLDTNIHLTIHIYIHIYLYMYIHIYVCVQLSIYLCMYVCMCLCMCIYIYIYIYYIYIYINKQSVSNFPPALIPTLRHEKGPQSCPRISKISGLVTFERLKYIVLQYQWPYMGIGQNLIPLVNIKVAGKWMFISIKFYL